MFHYLSQAWWYMSTLLALQRQKQKDQGVQYRTPLHNELVLRNNFFPIVWCDTGKSLAWISSSHISSPSLGVYILGSLEWAQLRPAAATLPGLQNLCPMLDLVNQKLHFIYIPEEDLCAHTSWRSSPAGKIPASVLQANRELRSSHQRCRCPPHWCQLYISLLPLWQVLCLPLCRCWFTVHYYLFVYLFIVSVQECRVQRAACGNCYFHHVDSWHWT